MDWRAKGLLQKVLGSVPGGDSIHYQLQRKFGGLRNFDREFDIKVDDWRLMANQLREAGVPMVGARLFEIGSGWYPTFPLSCFLAGAQRVVTVDLSRHQRSELVRACALGLGRHTALIADMAGVSEAEVCRRQQQLVGSLARSADLGVATEGVVVYQAPADAAGTDLPPDQIDCVFSNSVLEHVAPAAIDGIFREAMRMLRPGGIMFHSVNCGDHYAYVDRQITQLNYLQYSDEQWKRWDNAFLYQNRLRADAFIEYAEAAGFQIVTRVTSPPAKRLRELAALKVAPQFARVPPERLCITSIDFIARKPVAGLA
jgi:SAM-dependent methyltransferase